MNDFKGYLMAVDLDGTLLDSRRRVSEQNRAAIEKWRSLGGEICLASGRSADSLRRYWSRLGCDLPVICGNGSGIYDYRTESFLYHVELPEGGRELAAAADEALPDSGITVYKDGKVYFCKENSVTRRNRDNEGLPYRRADYRTLPYPWEKILLCQEAEHTEKAALLMEKLADREKFRLLKSAPVYYEVLSPEADKGAALRRYCALMGFAPEKTVAVGDNENDVNMLLCSAYSFTVANCTPPARRAAKWVVGSNDESCLESVLEICLSPDFERETAERHIFAGLANCTKNNN